MPDDPELTPDTRQAVIDAIQHGMLFDGRRRIHNWDSINAQVAAEKPTRSNFVIMRGPPTSGPGPMSGAGKNDEE